MNNQLIGCFKGRTFKRSAECILNGQKFSFKTTGFVSPQTQIFDNTQKKVIGKISHTWFMGAKLTFPNEKLRWKCDNLSGTKWRIFNSDRTLLKYNIHISGGGKFVSTTDDNALLLSGLYLIHYYTSISGLTLILVMLPLWMGILKELLDGFI